MRIADDSRRGSHGKLSRTERGCLAALACGMIWLAGTGAATAADPVLKYQFKPGAKYVYEVKIEADLPDSKESHTGYSRYTVKSVDAKTGNMTLINTGSLAQKKTFKSSPGRFPRVPRPPSPFGSNQFAAQRELTIDPTGRVVSYKGESQLPFLLGNLSQLILDPLPAAAQKAWEVKVAVNISETQDRFPPVPVFVAGDSNVNRTAQELLSYKLASTDKDIAVIEKTVDLRTEEQEGSGSTFEQTGKGTIRFNTQTGVPQSLDMKLTMNVNRDNVTVRMPTIISARLLDAAEVEKIDREAAAAAEVAAAAAKEAARPKPIDDAALDQVLADLKAKDDFKIGGALDRLTLAIPLEQRQGDVEKAVEPLLEDRNGFVRAKAVKALGIWGTKDAVPQLIKALDDDFAFAKGEAMDALAKRKDARGAEELAKRIPDFFSRAGASKALIEMGEMSEGPVLPLLKDKDWRIQAEAAKILGAIGTAKSVKPLSELKDDRGPLGTEVKKALEAIEARKGK